MLAATSTGSSRSARGCRSPLDVLSAQGAAGGSDPALGAGAAGRRAAGDHSTHLDRAFPGVWAPEEWRQMGREKLRVARCRVRRLMREMGLAGAVRGRAWVTTTQALPDAPRPADLVERQFTATRPNRLWVSNFTYVATWRGF